MNPHGHYPDHQFRRILGILSITACKATNADNSRPGSDGSNFVCDCHPDFGKSPSSSPCLSELLRPSVVFPFIHREESTRDLSIPVVVVPCRMENGFSPTNGTIEKISLFNLMG